MTKYEALIELIRDSRNERVSSASAKRVVKAAKTVGLNAEEIVRLMSRLDYCNAEGKPYNDKVKRCW